MKALVLTLALAACAAVHPQPAPRFAGAMPDEQRVRFTPIDSVDWRAAATSQAVGFDVDYPTSADIAMLATLRNEYFNADITFPVPISATAGGGCKYLVSPSGIHRVAIESLRGTARFSFEPGSRTHISNRTFFGYAYASPPLIEGGFILQTGVCGGVQVVTDAQIALRQTSDGGMILHYRAPTMHSQMVMPRPWFSEMATAYALVASGEHFIFVQWPSDITAVAGPYCESNFSIYSVEAGSLREVSSNQFDCEV